MVGMSLAIIVPLATYFPAHELDEARTSRHDRAKVYAGLASQQLRSAVAFSDRETAREVLNAIAKDPIIEGIAVYSGQGKELHGEGQRSDLARRMGRAGVRETTAYYLPGRILAVAPIQSLEGARGSVVLELSTQSLRRMQRRLVSGALAVGGASLVLGSLLAWLIARSLAQRIETIADGASAMERGELDHAIDVTGPNDELGQLSHGFNAMSRKVADLVDQIQRSAQEESARLEHLVDERTYELHTKHRDLQLVLNNIEQGFVIIDRRARVVGEYSRVIRTWLGPVDAEASLWTQLTRGAPDTAVTFELAWEQVVEAFLPLEATLDQMPARLEIGARHLAFEYRPLGGLHFDRLLVVMTDVTAVVAQEAAEQENHELVGLTARLVKDRAGLLEFLSESQRLVESITADDADPITLKRDLHTLKGNSGLYGLPRLSRLCHELESALEDEPAAKLDYAPLRASWERCLVTARRLLGSDTAKPLQVSEDDYTTLLAAVRRGAPRQELERALRTWRLEPLRARLERLAEQLVSTAARLGKGDATVRVRASNVYSGREELGEFWSAFSHVIRNAAVHGLESREIRAQKARGAQADFDLFAGIDADRLVIELGDTGPGIDWQMVRARASARGIAHATQAELEEALFADGLSTRSDVSLQAGRGVGLSAVRAACARSHGNIKVSTTPGAGTRFHFSWPVSRFSSLVQVGSSGAT